MLMVLMHTYINTCKMKDLPALIRHHDIIAEQSRLLITFTLCALSLYSTILKHFNSHLKIKLFHI